jgi:hypothetical protein
MKSVHLLRDLGSSSPSVDVRDARSVLEGGYACLLSGKPDGVLDLLDCGASWQYGSDITLLHALLLLLEFISTLKSSNVGLELIETSGRSVLITIHVRGVGSETSIDVDFNLAHKWTFREDGVIAFQWFASPDEARHTLGERPSRRHHVAI